MEPTEAIATLTHSGAIEGFAIEPIPDELKTVRWPDLFLLVSNFLINPSTILIGGLAVASGLSFWATILSSTLGIVIRVCGLRHHGDGRGGLWHHRAGGMPHGLRHPRCEVAALGDAHHCFRLLVRHADHCGSDGDCRHRATSGPGAHYSVVRTGMVLASAAGLLCPDWI